MALTLPGQSQASTYHFQHVLTIKVKGQHTFWYPLGVWQTFGYVARAGQNLETVFLQKHKMAAISFIMDL